MSGFELCVNTDAPGGGARYAALEDAKLAGWRAIGALADDLPSAGAFFTVHELASDGSATILAFDSRNEAADA